MFTVLEAKVVYALRTRRTVIIKADMHIHSNVSDGSASPKEIVQEAYYKGLNLISITDHDTFLGSMIAQKYGKDYDIIIVPGAEIATDNGDVLVYCIKPLSIIPRTLELLIRVAKENNCILVPAHPFDENRNSIGDLIFEYQWDAIEVYNLNSSRKANEKARRAAQILGVLGIGNSDAHRLEDMGKVYSELRLLTNEYNILSLNPYLIINCIREESIQIKIIKT